MVIVGLFDEVVEVVGSILLRCAGGGVVLRVLFALVWREDALVLLEDLTQACVIDAMPHPLGMGVSPTASLHGVQDDLTGEFRTDLRAVLRVCVNPGSEVFDF